MRTIEEIRAALKARQHRCDPKCLGWAVFDSDSYGLTICRCDDCIHGDPVAGWIMDDDIMRLPEAIAQLRRELHEARVRPPWQTPIARHMTPDEIREFKRRRMLQKHGHPDPRSPDQRYAIRDWWMHEDDAA